MLTPKQLELRRQGIGSSDISALTGHNPWISPWDVYRSKTSEDYAREQTFKMRLGELMEPVIIQLATERLGHAILDDLDTVKHPTLPLVDTPDGILSDDSALVEAKCCEPWASQEFGADRTDEVKPAYLIQATWHMGVWSAVHAERKPVKLCYMPVLFGTQELRIFKIGFDEGLFGNLVKVAVDFWERHVVPREPPPVDGTPACTFGLMDRYPVERAPLKDADEVAARFARTYQDARAAEAKAKALKEEAGNQLRNHVADAEGVKGSDFYATWKQNKTGKRVLRVKFTDEGDET